MNAFKVKSCVGDKILKNIFKKAHRKKKKRLQAKEKKIMILEGMVCGHWEGRWKCTKKKIDINGVTSAEVSHVSKQAIVTLNKKYLMKDYVKAVEAEDYTVTQNWGNN